MLENARVRTAGSGKQPSELIPTLLNVSHINRIKAITPAKLRNISYLHEDLPAQLVRAVYSIAHE